MINQYKHLIHSTRHFENLNIQAGSDYRYQDILSLESFELANKEISSWDRYESTPLHSLSDLASDSGVHRKNTISCN
jgi:hypothetical protein